MTASDSASVLSTGDGAVRHPVGGAGDVAAAAHAARGAHALGRAAVHRARLRTRGAPY